MERTDDQIDKAVSGLALTPVDQQRSCVRECVYVCVRVCVCACVRVRMC